MKREELYLQKNYLKEIITNDFRYIGEIRSLKPINHNDINSKNFLVECKKSKYVLKFLRNHQKKRNYQIQRILNKANLNGIKVAIPMKNVSKKKETDSAVFLFKFHNGKIFSGSSKELESFALELARLHKFLKKYKVRLEPERNFQTYQILSSSEFREIKNHIQKKSAIDKTDKIVIKKLEFLKKISKSHKIFEKEYESFNFKKQLIHNDLHINNIMFSKRNVSVILDFYFMKNGVVLEDVTYSALRLAEQTSRKFIEIEKIVNNFLKMYSKYNKIDNDELQNFNYFLSKNSLARINHILRNKYFYNSNFWVQQLPLHLRLLEFSYRIQLEV